MLVKMWLILKNLANVCKVCRYLGTQRPGLGSRHCNVCIYFDRIFLEMDIKYSFLFSTYPLACRCFLILFYWYFSFFSLFYIFIYFKCILFYFILFVAKRRTVTDWLTYLYVQVCWGLLHVCYTLVVEMYVYIYVYI